MSNKRHDVNTVASGIVASLTGLPPPKGVYEALLKRQTAKKKAARKNAAAVALGKLGGAKGGKMRAKSLSPEQRSEIAKKGAAARWKKRGKRQPTDEARVKIEAASSTLRRWESEMARLELSGEGLPPAAKAEIARFNQRAKELQAMLGEIQKGILQPANSR